MTNRTPHIQHVEYWNKPNPELRFIIRDASEAALNMRTIDPVAEAKYLDQINDATTVLWYRKNG